MSRDKMMNRRSTAKAMGRMLSWNTVSITLLMDDGIYEGRRNLFERRNS